MVTGRISLRVPLYSPISSSVSEVRFTSSCFHCRAETVLVTRIRVVDFACAIDPAPTSVLPAPQAGRRHRCAVPEVLHRLLLVGAQRPAVLGQLDGVRLAVDVARQVLGRPAQLQQRLLDLPRSEGCTATVSGSMRAPTSGMIRLDFSTSSRTGRSVVVRTSPCAGCLVRVSRP